jgi:hypothetical protein
MRQMRGDDESEMDEHVSVAAASHRAPLDRRTSNDEMSHVDEIGLSTPRAGRLLWVGPITVLASTAAVVVVQWLAATTLSPPSGIPPVSAHQRQMQLLRSTNEPAIFTAVLVTGAVLVFAVVCREAANPFQTYRRIALVTLLVSFVPDILAAAWPLFGWPLAMVYILMHVTAWAVCVTMLTALVR